MSITTVRGLGGYDAYGQAERADVTVAEDLLPMGLAEGCRLRTDVPRDQVLSYANVELPPGRLVDQLRTQQAAEWPTLAVIGA
jgi:predicted homoserine dehydrogenase-like protein